MSDRSATKVINVDDCISQLGLCRRRIYDIINILESFKIIKRLRKNEYEMKSAILIKHMIEQIEVSQLTFSKFIEFYNS